jgi:hypothetical protein
VANKWKASSASSGYESRFAYEISFCHHAISHFKAHTLIRGRQSRESLHVFLHKQKSGFVELIDGAIKCRDGWALRVRGKTLSKMRLCKRLASSCTTAKSRTFLDGVSRRCQADAASAKSAVLTRRSRRKRCHKNV